MLSVIESGPEESRPTNHRRWALTLAVAVASLVAGALVMWSLARIRGGPELVVAGVKTEGTSGRIVLFAHILSILGLSAIGAAIAARVPKNPIGWILLGTGSWGGLTLFLVSLLAWSGSGSLVSMSEWIGRWTFVPLISIPITFVLMLVPAGRLPSARWRILPWLAVIGIAGWAASEAFSDKTASSIPNAYFNPTVGAVAAMASLVLAPAMIGSALSVVAQFRGADQNARQQIKWVAFGGALQVVITILLWILSAVRPAAFGTTVVAVGSVSGLITPTATGVAIFRYRLYDIDRLINRTITYGATVGVLAATFGAVAIGIPQLLDLPGDSPLLVASATLASFAVFRPATRWFQSAIDRRFNRSHYDAQREVESFTSTLTQGVAMDQVIAVTTSLLQRTLQPDELGVWIRDPQRSH